MPCNSRQRLVLSALLWTACCAVDAASPPSIGWHIAAPGVGVEQNATLSLNALREVKGWRKTAVPVLTIQCNKEKAAVYVETGLPLEVTMVDKQIVRVRFDDDDFVTQRWREVNNSAVSPRDAAAVIAQLARSRRFVLEFSPFSSPPAQAEFAVNGLSDYLPLLEGKCWKK
jgi:hypothetical protein